MTKARLKFNESFCSSCVYAIEHTGRKLDGVDDVLFDASTGVITLKYSGDPKVLERFTQLTFTLGHGAEVISTGKEKP